MKKISFFAIVTLMLFSQGCEKDSSTTINSDLKLFAYAGILAGSSGYYTLTINEMGADAVVTIDNTAYPLSVTKKIKKDEDIDSLVLSDGNVKLIYTFHYATQTPSVIISIPGHDVQNTIGILYDYRYPKLYSKIKEAVQLYKGTSTSTYNTSYISFTYFFGLNMIDKSYAALEKCTDSNFPSDIGRITPYTGTFSETDTTLTFNFPDGPLTLLKNGNNLEYNDSGPDNYTFVMLLKKIDL